MCGAMPAGIFLMQWYDPLNKFMLLKHFDCVLPSPLNVFKMVITPEMEYPMVCVSVKQPYQQNKLKLDLINMNSGASWFHSDELEDMDGSGILMFYIYSTITVYLFTIFIFDFQISENLIFIDPENASSLFCNKNIVSATVIPRRENLNVINVTQFEKDAILVCYDSEYYFNGY